MNRKQMIHINELPVITSRGGKLKVFASPRVLNSRNLVLGNTILSPGEETIEHIHDYSDELFYIQKGEGILLLEKKEYNVARGNVVIIKQGQPHKLTNNGKEDMELIFASAPLAPVHDVGHRDV